MKRERWGNEYKDGCEWNSSTRTQTITISSWRCDIWRDNICSPMILFRWYLWFAPNAICAATLILAVRKAVHKRFPSFLVLMAFSLVQLCAGLIIAFRSSQRIYKWSVVFGLMITFAIQIVLFSEILRELLPVRASVRKILQNWPRVIAAILVLLAVGSAALLPDTATEAAHAVFQTANYASNFVAVGLVLALMTFSRIFAVSWCSLAGGIAFGLAIAGTGDVVTSVLMAEWGRKSYIWLDMIRMIGFHICTLVWFVSVLLAERVPTPSIPSLGTVDIQAEIAAMRRFSSL